MRIQSNVRIHAQKKIVSRVFAKHYTSLLKKNAVQELIQKGIFNSYNRETIKDRMLSEIYKKTEINKDKISSIRVFNESIKLN